MFEFLPDDISAQLFGYILFVGFLAGVIKGVVGFAMPMVFVTGLTIFVAPDLALAMLILPTMVTNVWQAGRQGLSAGLQAIWDHRWFLLMSYALLVATTQIVPYLSISLFFLVLGVLVVTFACILLTGWMPSARQAGPARLICAIVAGIAAGVSAIWGPPTVAYLSTLSLDRKSFMRAQGVIYGTGAVLFLAGHIWSGVVTWDRILVSIPVLPAALLGIWVGFQIQDRIDQVTFRRAILITLILAGLNLIRRGITG